MDSNVAYLETDNADERTAEYQMRIFIDNCDVTLNFCREENSDKLKEIKKLMLHSMSSVS